MSDKKLYPVYKRIKVAKPHCPKCGELLSGNNSMISPWECSCGIWRVEDIFNPFSYRHEKRPAADDAAAG